MKSRRLKVWTEDGYLRIETFTRSSQIGIWLSSWFSTYLEAKWVGWFFYSKIRFGFGHVGVEYINNAKTTYRQTVRSIVLSREIEPLYSVKKAFRKGKGVCDEDS